MEVNCSGVEDTSDDASDSTSGHDCSVPKKARLGETEDIFNRFHKMEKMVSSLKAAFEQLRDWKGYGWTVMKISFCNAAAGKDYGFSFSDAQCLGNVCQEMVFSFVKFFSHGGGILESYIETGKPPQDQYHRQILARLLIYLLHCKGDQDTLRKLTQRRNIQETTLAAAFGQHLLSKLSISGLYTLDKHYHNDPNSNIQTKTCPCGCQDEFCGLYGDNSIGDSRCWHGNIDIIVPGSELAVKVCAEKKPLSPGCKSAFEDEDEDENQEDKDEVHEDKCIQSDKATQQSLAQTIVFSFLQKTRHPEYEHFLIPTLGLSKKEMIFYFYDSKKDILMKSPPFLLFPDSETILLESIVACWLVLHYNAFGSGVPDDLSAKIPNSNFSTLARDKLSIYEKKLSFGDVRGTPFNFHIYPYTWKNAEFYK